MHLKAELKLRRDYTCCSCGHQQMGDTEHFVFERIDNVSGVQNDMYMFLNRLRQNGDPNQMPVGWSSYGEGIMYCHVCGDKREQEYLALR